MKIAYIILCHKNPDQINKMINVLNTPESDFFIHVDKKSSIGSKLISASNVYILPKEKRISIFWGDISMIKATYNLLEVVFNSGKVFDYIWLISGQDFPLKCGNSIQQYLNKHKGENFIQIIDRHNTGYNRFLKRNELYYFDCMKKMTPLSRILKLIYIFLTGGVNKTMLFKRKNLLNLDFYFGSQWWTLTYECAREIFDMMKDPKYLNFYKHCLVPDESIFQTLYMKSNFKNTYSDILTYIDWDNNSNHPKTFKIKDYNALIDLEYLMARKFDENIDDEVIEKIYNKLIQEKEKI